MPVVISVVLVEDQKPIQAALAEMLSARAGFEVSGTATTEAEANLWLDEHQGGWNLAVVDLVLQEGTGMGVVAHARRTAPGSRIAVFSDFATPGIEAHCLRLGADAVFDKSQGPAALIAWCRATFA
jgi:DNA-binding NarL/FixJ family response regulator